MKKKFLMQSIFGILLMTGLITPLKTQSSEEKIRAVREASNTALKALDEEANLEFLTDDVLITTGAGTLLSGKDELISYIENLAGTSPMYFVRSTEEIIVNEERGLAWETGVWQAYKAEDQNGISPVYHGKYSAQWTMISDEWKIKSQLFVTLN